MLLLPSALINRLMFSGSFMTPGDGARVTSDDSFDGKLQLQVNGGAEDT